MYIPTSPPQKNPLRRYPRSGEARTSWATDGFLNPAEWERFISHGWGCPFPPPSPLLPRAHHAGDVPDCIAAFGCRHHVPHSLQLQGTSSGGGGSSSSGGPSTALLPQSSTETVTRVPLQISPSDQATAEVIVGNLQLEGTAIFPSFLAIN